MFDLYNVYRYTHGAPEGQESWWLGQLHKSLFDASEVATLLSASGFAQYAIFCYAYPGDTKRSPSRWGSMRRSTRCRRRTCSSVV